MQKSHRAEDLVEGLKNLVWLAVILGVLGIIYAGYQQADEAGWIRHSTNASVMFPPHGWEQGQYVACFAVISTSNTIVLDCSEATLSTIITREMDVVFWGKVNDRSTRYRCQRDPDSITCHLDETQPTPNPSN